MDVPSTNANARPADGRAIDAGGYVGDMKLVDAIVSQSSVEATFNTPEGGFEGPSPEDLDTAPGAVFRTVYGEVQYPTDGVVVIFKGGLTNTATGKDLPDEQTGRYSISGSQADEIDWSDSDAVEYVIDWSHYRDFVHPALIKD